MQQQGLAVALALGVPTGLFCAVVFARKFKEAARYKQEIAVITAKKEQEIAVITAKKEQELADITAKKEQELADITAKKEQELAVITVKQKQEIADNYVQRDTHENLQKARDWFYSRAYMQTEALELYMLLKKDPTNLEEGALRAWRWITSIHWLIIRFTRMHPEGHTAMDANDYWRKLFGYTHTRELSTSGFTTQKVLPIESEELLEELQNVFQTLKSTSFETSADPALSSLSELMRFALHCFEHFFTSLTPNMTEQAFFDAYIPSDLRENNVLDIWANYFVPSP